MILLIGSLLPNSTFCLNPPSRSWIHSGLFILLQNMIRQEVWLHAMLLNLWWGLPRIFIWSLGVLFTPFLWLLSSVWLEKYIKTRNCFEIKGTSDFWRTFGVGDFQHCGNHSTNQESLEESWPGHNFFEICRQFFQVCFLWFEVLPCRRFHSWETLWMECWWPTSPFTPGGKRRLELL